MGTLLRSNVPLILARDSRSNAQRSRAEHLSRLAAANAHASYYAHPKLHLHTYLPKRSESGTVLPDSEQDGAVIEAMNGPAPSQAVHDPDQDVDHDGTKGTREEEGGKENAGKPSGLDKGAKEIDGEAGGTHTSPGPTAAEVERYKSTQNGWDDHARGGGVGAASQVNGDLSGSLNVPGQANGDARPGMVRHFSVSQSMEPHLQLM